LFPAGTTTFFFLIFTGGPKKGSHISSSANIDEDEDDLGLDEFDDDYSEDDLTDFNEYEY
jgi:hypothetical protein